MTVTTPTPEAEAPVRAQKPAAQGLDEALAIMKIAKGHELSLIPGFVPRVVVGRQTFMITDWTFWSSAKIEAEVVAGLNEDARAELEVEGSVTFLHRVDGEALWVSITKIDSFISAMFRKEADLSSAKMGGMPF